MAVRVVTNPAPGTGERSVVVAASANGAVSVRPCTVYITKATAAALTLADPAASDNGVSIHFVSTTAAAHTISNAAGSGFNAGGTGSDVATLGGAKGDGLSVTAYGGKWYVTGNINATLA